MFMVMENDFSHLMWKEMFPAKSFTIPKYNLQICNGLGFPKLTFI